MSYYTFHKGKHGGVAGYIFPFFTPLSSLFPNEEYAGIVPAGFLKCQGQILSANQYRSLAKAIGVGSACIYKKEGVDLAEPDAKGEGGQIQLPDLGSKYIAGAVNPGLYSNYETSNPAIDRAGISTEITSAGSTVDFFYTGDFKVPSRSLSLTGNITTVSPPTRTEETSLSPGNFLPHAHNSTLRVGRRVNLNSRGTSSGRWIKLNYYCRRSGSLCNNFSNFGLKFVNNELVEYGTDEGSGHNHIGAFPSLSSETKTAGIAEITVPASSITTRVNLRVNQKVKMDEFAPKYILCEYLIKY